MVTAEINYWWVWTKAYMEVFQANVTVQHKHVIMPPIQKVKTDVFYTHLRSIHTKRTVY